MDMAWQEDPAYDGHCNNTISLSQASSTTNFKDG